MTRSASRHYLRCRDGCDVIMCVHHVVLSVQLTELSNLDCCVRLQRLYAQGNKLRTLIGSSLLSFRFLRELDVSNNSITNLDETLSVLRHFAFLEHLGMVWRVCVHVLVLARYCPPLLLLLLLLCLLPLGRAVCWGGLIPCRWCR